MVRQSDSHEAVANAERELALASLHHAETGAPAWIKALLFVLKPCCGLEGSWSRLVNLLPTDLQANVELQLSILMPTSHLLYYDAPVR